MLSNLEKEPVYLEHEEHCLTLGEEIQEQLVKNIEEHDPIHLLENPTEDKDVTKKKTNKLSFKDIFDAYLTPKKRVAIAKYFVDVLVLERVPLKDRLTIFQMILHILGEDAELTKADMEKIKGISLKIL